MDNSVSARTNIVQVHNRSANFVVVTTTANKVASQERKVVVEPKATEINFPSLEGVVFIAVDMVVVNVSKMATPLVTIIKNIVSEEVFCSERVVVDRFRINPMLATTMFKVACIETMQVAPVERTVDFG